MHALKIPKSISLTDATMAAAVVLSLVSLGAVAGADNTFDAASTFLNTSLTGSLGKTFALGSLAVGLGVGIVKQSVMAVAIGVGMALVSSIGPGILTGMFTAVI